MIGGNLGAAVQMLKVMNQQGGIGAGGGYNIVNTEVTDYISGLTTPLSMIGLSLLTLKLQN